MAFQSLTSSQQKAASTSVIVKILTWLFLLQGIGNVLSPFLSLPLDKNLNLQPQTQTFSLTTVFDVGVGILLIASALGLRYRKPWWIYTIFAVIAIDIIQLLLAFLFSTIMTGSAILGSEQYVETIIGIVINGLIALYLWRMFRINKQ